MSAPTASVDRAPSLVEHDRGTPTPTPTPSIKSQSHSQSHPSSSPAVKQEPSLAKPAVPAPSRDGGVPSPPAPIGKGLPDDESLPARLTDGLTGASVPQDVIPRSSTPASTSTTASRAVGAQTAPPTIAPPSAALGRPKTIPGLSATAIATAEGAAGRWGELKRFTLWETKTRFYMVAFNTSQTRFRILKLDRTAPQPRQSLEQDGAAGGSRDASSTNADPSTATGTGTASGQAAGSAQSGADATAVPGQATGKPSSDGWELNVTSDRVVYTRTQVRELLDMIAEGNRATGGLKEVGRFFGIVGFIRFTGTYYMVLISKRSMVALIGGHYVYHCEETKILPVCHASVIAALPGRSKAKEQEEARLLHTFKQVDLSKNFYFSYTYDLTKTLQDNLTAGSAPAEAEAPSSLGGGESAWGYNEKFVWNHHLLLPAFGDSRHRSAFAPVPSSSADVSENDSAVAAAEWVLPLVHGFVDQAKLSVLNRTVYVTLIARRSRHFAGARFLKRGTDEQGHVANDVETEQIVCEALTTPFYAPRKRHARARHIAADGEHQDDGSGDEDDGGDHEGGEARRGADPRRNFGPNPRFTSYVMNRGSIPVYWTQDSTNMSPRPPIEISVVDPYFSSAALHFDDMFRRYGHPIIVLNLIKSKERQPREVKLLRAFGECISYLNQFLPDDKRLKYIAWDMSRASKSHDQDVIGVLEDIAEETVEATRFFHSGPALSGPTRRAAAGGGHLGQPRETIQLQSGIARVNCVDCLDRTNAAQFVIGKAAFGHQLHALGLLDNPALPFDSDAVDMLTEMYHDLGDTIALQYGGSHLVNTMETYRKINQWRSHSRDMLEGLKRYYANSVLDADKQAAINLFLGVDPDAQDFKPITGFDLQGRRIERRHYQRWFTPAFLQPQSTLRMKARRLRQVVTSDVGFWAEYYRPSLFTDFTRHHAFKMTAIHQQQDPTAALQARGAYDATSSPRSTRQRLVSGLIKSPSMGSLSEIQSSSAASQALSSSRSTTISPFTARLGSGTSLATSLRRSSDAASTVADTASLSGTRSNPRALIGGVRRWMSLNKLNEEAVGGKSPRRASRRSTIKSELEVNGRGSASASGIHGEGIPRQGSGALGMNEGLDAWPVWDHVPGSDATSSSAPALEATVRRLLDPTVSEAEAYEYTKWIDQFREAHLDGAGDAEGLLDRMDVAEEDIEVYNDHVGMPNGLGATALQAYLAATGGAGGAHPNSGVGQGHEPASSLGGGTMGFGSAQAQAQTDYYYESTIAGGSSSDAMLSAPPVDPALVSYGNAVKRLAGWTGTANPGATTEAKLKAYSQYLYGFEKSNTNAASNSTGLVSSTPQLQVGNNNKNVASQRPTATSRLTETHLAEKGRREQDGGGRGARKTTTAKAAMNNDRYHNAATAVGLAGA